MNRIQKILGSTIVASFLMIAPLAASADTLNAAGSAGVGINPSGIASVLHEGVTALSDDVFNAVTAMSDVIRGWVGNVSTGTAFAETSSNDAASTGVTAGDRTGSANALSHDNGSDGGNGSIGVNANTSVHADEGAESDDSNGIHAGANLSSGIHIGE